MSGSVEIAIHGEADKVPGGYAAVIRREGSTAAEIITGGNPKTTANRMELTAAIEAFRHLNEAPEPANAAVTVNTASEYVSNAFNKGWLEKWQGNGWKNNQGADVRNSDLWKELQQEIGGRRPVWHHVKEADEECRRQAQQAVETTARQKQVWLKSAGAAQIPDQAPPDPPVTPVSGANAVEQALIQNQSAREALERAWRLGQEPGAAAEIRQELQEAMNRLESQAPNLARAAQGLRLLEQATE